MDTKIVFMGSPDFAIPSLKALANNYAVIGVVTQPDRRSGRGRKLVAPPIKKLAQGLSLPILQPSNLRRDTNAKNQIKKWNPDLIIVAAFGQILERDLLDLPPFGCLNVHASLLPRWRGVSPIQAAILYGDAVTGITIMKMDEGIDTGDILAQRSIPIEPTDTGGSLFKKLAHLGGDLLLETLPEYLKGNISPHLQGPSPTPYASMLKKSDGELDFNQPASDLSRQIRAYYPWPGTFTTWQGKTLKIIKGHALDCPSPGIGSFTIHNEKPAIGTSKGILIIDEIQPAGKRPMKGKAFLQGARDWKENL